jgi:hypothetical protein
MRIQRTLQQQTAEQLERFFGPDGGIAKKYGGKSRWSQVEMARTVNRAFYESHSMLVEAPTGTGKTLAYLIPTALYLREQPKQRSSSPLPPSTCSPRLNGISKGSPTNSRNSNKARCSRAPQIISA